METKKQTKRTKDFFGKFEVSYTFNDLLRPLKYRRAKIKGINQIKDKKEINGQVMQLTLK